MSLYEIYQPSGLHYNNNIDPFFMDNDDMGEYSSSPRFSSKEHSSEISYSMQYLETILSNEYMEFPTNSSIDNFQTVFDEFNRVFNGEANNDDMAKSLDEHGEVNYDDHAMDVCETYMAITSMALVLPFEGMKIDDQLLVHLFMAYAEAMDNQETELSQIISQRIIKKVNPLGGPVERLLYYMFKHLDSQSSYLIQESTKNFFLAFKAFYQISIHGKFAHLVANLAILEALPRDVEIIYILDFDIGEGVQWVSFIEAIKHLNIEIRVISLEFSEEDEISPPIWTFEYTKRMLIDHSCSYGLRIEIEEVGLQDFESMIKNMRKNNYRRKSFYIFNCSVGIAHMARVRSKKDVNEFLRVSKDFLHKLTCGKNKGIITYSDGYACHDTKTCFSYKSYLEANFVHYRALLESIEFDFPSHFGEGRMALECLFVSPYVSYATWDRKWDEDKEYGEVHFGQGLKGWKLSEVSLNEAKEMVNKRGGLYGVRIEGEMKNEMVMEWNRTPLVKVCFWTS